jgi:hypothetical protein
MLRHRLNSAILLALFLSASTFATGQSNLTTPQVPSSDPQAYCTYLNEQAHAQSDLLRTPNGVAAFTQPDTGLPTQLVAGATLSLSSLKKAGITVDAARKNCELYKASTSVQQYLQYALQSIEKEALSNRLNLIDQASKSLDALIDKTARMVDAQNLTRPMLWALKTNRIKLDSDRADTQSRIAAIYAPPLSSEPINTLVAEKQARDVSEQRAQARLTRQNNWDVALTVGAHQQINPVSDGVQPYGEVTATYNFASRAIDRHLDRAVDAYADWKKVQEGDVVRNAEVLRTQVVDAVAAQESRLKSLQEEAAELDSDLKLVAVPDTSAAIDFNNQLASTKLLLEIETGDATWRLHRLQEFLASNY